MNKLSIQSAQADFELEMEIETASQMLDDAASDEEVDSCRAALAKLVNSRSPEQIFIIEQARQRRRGQGKQ